MEYSSLARKVGAELVGTFGLVTAGCGAIIVSSQGALSAIGVALAFGVIIAVMVAATGHISGGHINPAVSIGLAVTGHLPWRDLPFYLLGQFVGAILAGLTLLGIFGSSALTLTVNAPALHVGLLQATCVEALLTAFLVFVISAVATDTQGIGKVAAFAIGATILVDALWGGPLTGASMNPARSFGPALLTLHWTNLWIYFVGPIIGGIIGAVVYHLIRQPAAQEERTASPTLSGT
ncbi:MAG TPA: MIP family channel protein [Ktedonobacteraceae bacterium]|jgi:MIP family channel proteins